MSGHWPLLNLTIVSIGKSAHFELIKSIICSGWDTKGKQKQLRAPYYMLKDALYFCPNFTGYDNTLTRQSWERRRRGQIRHSMNRQSTPGQSTQSVTGGRQKLWNARGQKCRNHTCGAAERNRNQRLIHSM